METFEENKKHVIDFDDPIEEIRRTIKIRKKIKAKRLALKNKHEKTETILER